MPKDKFSYLWASFGSHGWLHQSSCFDAENLLGMLALNHIEHHFLCISWKIAKVKFQEVLKPSIGIWVIPE